MKKIKEQHLLLFSISRCWRWGGDSNPFLEPILGAGVMKVEIIVGTTYSQGRGLKSRL
jgi:hypothetical protein